MHYFFFLQKEETTFCAIEKKIMFSFAIDVSKTSPTKNLRTKMNIPDIKNVLKDGLVVKILI